MLLAPLGDRFEAPSEPFAHCPYVHCELPSSAACTDVRQTPSWAGVCPGNNESAGKRKSARIPKGNKTALVEAATPRPRTRGTYLRDKFCRLKGRRGYKRGVVAIAHKILTSIYHMFSQQVLTTIWEIFT
jgi:hypothetical protein